ncbi:MAG: response regulator [Actinomycetota bacterium]
MTKHGLIAVVLADDAEDIRRILKIKLSRDGRFDVAGEAADGRELLNMVEVLKPDAIVVDLSMPVMDGLEVIPLIKLSHPHCKILALSGFAGDEMGARAIARGADAYLEKGVPLMVIVEKLVQLCPAENSPADSPERAAPLTAEESSHFIDFMVHQINEPLTVILGYAAMIRQALDEGGHDDLHAAAEAIERNAEALAVLLRALTEPATLEHLISAQRPLAG